MKKYWKGKWIKALTSGSFRQGGGGLWTKAKKRGHHNKFCCLGVLAQIQGAKFDEHGSPFLKDFKSDSLASLNGVLACGLTDRQQSILMGMNDDGVSFSKIAVWIKKNIKGE